MSTTRGQQLIGKEVGGCLLEEVIGYGGSSAVFLAQPQTTDQKVAVKVFLPRSVMDAPTQKSFYRRFLREAQAASELEHPNILSIYSYGEHQGLPYIVMPYVPGGTLSDYVKKHGPLTLREAQHYIQQIADALDYAHEHGCVHCDVKPANILLDGEGRVLLSDFGIVRFVQKANLNAQQSLKSSEMLMGTPEYVSPEQALGEQLDGRSDIYSLAVSLFYLLTGFPPFRSNSPISILLMHVHDDPPKLSSARADVTPRIDQVLDKALSKWPDDRYYTVKDFSRELSEAIDEAALTGSIDRVALTPNANKTLTEEKKEREARLQPVVEVRPLARPSFHITRGMAIAFVLGIVLLGSLTIAGIFNAAIAPHSPATSPAPSASPDILSAQTDLWPISSTFFFSQNGQYHILNKSKVSVALALYAEHTFANFRLTVTAREISHAENGVDYYGVVLRASENQSHYYVFEISPYDGGQYYIYRYDVGKGLKTLANGPAPSVKKLGQENTLSVVAMGNTFTFFVNGRQVGKPIVDTSASPYLSGEIGLSVEDQDEEVAFYGLSIVLISSK